MAVDGQGPDIEDHVVGCDMASMPWSWLGGVGLEFLGHDDIERAE